jgi:hypothetical protein
MTPNILHSDNPDVNRHETKLTPAQAVKHGKHISALTDNITQQTKHSKVRTTTRP